MSEWTVQAADTIEKTISAVRDRTVEPANRAANAIVYGVLAVCCVLTALLLISVVIFRLLSFVFPVWATWVILGGIFIAAGLFCWTRRAGESRA